MSLTGMVLALLLLLQSDCPACGRKADPKSPVCKSCKFDPRAAKRGYFVGKLSDTFEVSDGFTRAKLTVSDSKAASVRKFVDKRVRVQAISKGDAWLVQKIDEAAAPESDLVVRGSVKNGAKAKRLRAALLSEGSKEPLFVTDVQNAEAVLRIALPVKGDAKGYYGIVWDDADGDGLPNESGKSVTPTFFRRDNKWFDRADNALVESPITVALEIPE
jgi:hypothetical protein